MQLLKGKKLGEQINGGFNDISSAYESRYKHVRKPD
jgi:hypothetical protein